MREPDTHPDGLDHIRGPLVAVALLLALAASQCGCSGAAGIATMAGVVKTTLDAMRVTQRVLCSPALYPILGDPTEGQPVWVQKDAATAADAGDDR